VGANWATSAAGMSVGEALGSSAMRTVGTSLGEWAWGAAVGAEASGMAGAEIGAATGGLVGGIVGGILGGLGVPALKTLTDVISEKIDELSVELLNTEAGRAIVELSNPSFDRGGFP
jgi:hypothetical protein